MVTHICNDVQLDKLWQYTKVHDVLLNSHKDILDFQTAQIGMPIGTSPDKNET